MGERFTLQLVERVLPEPAPPGPTGHLLLQSKMDDYKRGFRLAPEAGDQIIAKMKLPMPITKELTSPPGVRLQPKVVGTLVSVHKHDVGPAGDWELYGVIEWVDGYDPAADGVPFIALMLDPPNEDGPRIMEVATTTTPVIEGQKEIKL